MQVRTVTSTGGNHLGLGSDDDCHPTSGADVRRRLGGDTAGLDLREVLRSDLLQVQRRRTEASLRDLLMTAHIDVVFRALGTGLEHGRRSRVDGLAEQLVGVSLSHRRRSGIDHHLVGRSGIGHLVGVDLLGRNVLGTAGVADHAVHGQVKGLRDQRTSRRDCLIGRHVNSGRRSDGPGGQGENGQTSESLLHRFLFDVDMD